MIVWLMHIQYYLRFGVFMAFRHWKISGGFILLYFLYALMPDFSPESNFSVDTQQLEAQLAARQLSDKFAIFAQQGLAKPIRLKGTSADELIEKALEYIGTPYLAGGHSAKGMDCSGLVHRAFADLAVKIPHNSTEIARFGQLIPQLNELMPGDLLFFTQPYSKQLITHTGIFLGDGQFIHTSTSAGVVVQPLATAYWERRFVFATRLFSD